jgi:hypothetical protein
VTYTVPPKPAEPKPRYVRVTDPAEIEAIQRAGLRDPIGRPEFEKHREGPYEVQTIIWYAEAHSLAQFRGQPVEFTV